MRFQPSTLRAKVTEWVFERPLYGPYWKVFFAVWICNSTLILSWAMISLPVIFYFGDDYPFLRTVFWWGILVGILCVGFVLMIEVWDDAGSIHSTDIRARVMFRTSADTLKEWNPVSIFRRILGF